MCDTFVAVSDKTIDGSVTFGKNSDREPNEPHHIEYIPGGKQEAAEVQTTYIAIPQVDEINSIFLSKPIWIWGAEMGANDKGVVIGNEAVWTTEQNNDEKLIGMDFLRLALERGNTAREALNVITDLLEKHGQGGNCGYYEKSFYDNSFIIADKNEAWVLETAGKFFIAEKVKGIRTISNVLTIENNYDLIHPELLAYAIEKGKCKSEEDFNFKIQFSSKFLPWAAKGDTRRACTFSILNEADGKVTPITAMNALRSHNQDNNNFNPRKSSMASPCLHASSLLTPSQSTASMVSHITNEMQVHWYTGTSSPCLSVFKPFIINEATTNLNATKPKKHFSDDNLWWKHEKIHRKTLLNYSVYTQAFTNEKDEMEKNLLSTLYNDDFSIKSLSEEQLAKLSHQAYQDNLEKIDDWENKLNEIIRNQKKSLSISNLRFRQYWKKLNKIAHF